MDNRIEGVAVGKEGNEWVGEDSLMREGRLVEEHRLMWGKDKDEGKEWLRGLLDRGSAVVVVVLVV